PIRGLVWVGAPLAAAAERGPTDLRAALASILTDLDVDDASLASRAILQASPAGLGQAERNDVAHPARVTLAQAMAEAADRDRIARQYATGYTDMFEPGLPAPAPAPARRSDHQSTVLPAH